MVEEIERSVTLWIRDVKKGDQAAARKLWERYFDRLVKSAGWKMRDMARRVADEEDIALSVFHSLYQGGKAGRFEQLQNRDDLWRLLIAITNHKIVDQVRRQTSQKRGAGDERGESVFQKLAEDGQQAGFEMFADTDPTPEFLLSLEEEHRRLLTQLRDDTLRTIASLKLEGYTNEEMAQQLGISVRTIERKSKLIREKWAAEIEL